MCVWSVATSYNYHTYSCHLLQPLSLHGCLQLANCFHLSGLALRKGGSLVKVKIAPKLHSLWSAEGRSFKHKARSSFSTLFESVLSVNISAKELLKKGWTGQLVVEGFGSVPKCVEGGYESQKRPDEPNKIFWSVEENSCQNLQEGGLRSAWDDVPCYCENCHLLDRLSKSCCSPLWWYAELLWALLCLQRAVRKKNR